MDINKFEELLKNHDWYYMHADDQRAWRAGSDSAALISAHVDDSTEHRELYNKYKK